LTSAECLVGEERWDWGCEGGRMAARVGEVIGGRVSSREWKGKGSGKGKRLGGEEVTLEEGLAGTVTSGKGT
jgi:hypothetical protein